MGGGVTIVDSHSCISGTEFIQTYVTFSATMDCPNSDGFTSINITPKGGQSPYEFKIDEQEYQSLEGTPFLKAGNQYTLTIRDASGIESQPQTITLASPINITLSKEPECSDDLQTYTATFTINGGIPPYSVNDVAIDGDSYTTEPIPSKTVFSISVIDSNKCTANTEILHNCCDLPCDGVALQSGYYFSLPDAKAAFQVSFAFEFPKDNTIDLSEDVQKLWQEVAGDGFSFAEKLNALIIENTKGIACLTFTYEPSKSDFMDTWWIEYFECLQFRLLFRSSISDFISGFFITPVGSTFGIRPPINIPAFNTSKMDKCHPKTPVEFVCPEELDLKLEIVPTLKFPALSLSVKSSGSDEPVVYFWEVQNSTTLISNNQDAEFTLLKSELKTTNIRLTVFTKQGCRFVQEEQILIN
jgi:hypothetical protein